MLQVVLKDIKKRKKFAQVEYILLVLKALYYNSFLNNQFKIIVKILLNSVGKRHSKYFIHNRCIITGRARSIIRLYNISRHKFRQFAYEGLLTGFIKV